MLLSGTHTVVIDGETFHLVDRAGETGGHQTVQAAVNAAQGGDTVLVAPGVYTENVALGTDGIKLLSVAGAEVTTIQGVGGLGALGALTLTPGADDIQIGDAARGFTIVGFDGVPAIETAAVYLQGNHDRLTILGNDIRANGDAGLMSEASAAVTNLLIASNVFSGKTFVGDRPGGIGFTGQFSELNVPRQLVVLGNGNGTGESASHHITFRNNHVTGTAGGVSANDGVTPQGNALVTIDASHSIVSNNVFSGFTDQYGVALRVRRNDTDVMDNTLDHRNGGNSRGIEVANGGSGSEYSGNLLLGGTLGGSYIMMPPGTEQVVYPDEATIGRSQDGRWTVKVGDKSTMLLGVDQVTIGTKTYLLVDNVGAGDGYTSVQAAHDAAQGGETILIAPGTYVETSLYVPGNQQGLRITKADLTFQGVDANGNFIDTAEAARSGGPVIVSGAQNMFGANHWIDSTADNTVLRGLTLKAGSQTNNKLLEIWGDNATVEASFLDVMIAEGQSSFAAAVYLNDSQTPSQGGEDPGDDITRYTIRNNALNEGIIIANGMGTPGTVAANQIISGNRFLDAFDYETGLGRYDTIAMLGRVDGTGSWLNESVQLPTITGNSIADGSVPVLLRWLDQDASLAPTAAQLAAAVDGLAGVGGKYAYVLNGDGQVDLMTRAIDFDGNPATANGQAHSFYVTNTISTLNLGQDNVDDSVFYGQKRIDMQAGDTIVVQTGAGAVNETIVVNGLKVRATQNSADLNLTLGAEVASVALEDYAAGQGANVDVTGNALANTIRGNSGANHLSGGDGDDLFIGSAGADALNGGEGLDTVSYEAGAVLGRNGGNWTVTVGGAVQTLTGVEKVRIGNTTYMLVDNAGGGNGFATIESAIEAAAAGDTILLAEGTYDEALTLDKRVTIEGVKKGVAGTGNGRGTGETVITGGVHITANGVVIDGMTIRDGGQFTGGRAGALIQADNVAIRNSIFLHAQSNTSDGSRAIATVTGDAQNLTVTGNLAVGWGTGLSLNPGATGTVSNNTFRQNFTGLYADQPSGLAIAGNTFDGNKLEQIGISLVGGGTVSVIGLNTFVNVGGAPEIKIYASNTGGTISGTAGNDVIEGSANSDTLNGDAGNDRLDAGGGNDALNGGEGIDTLNGGDGDDILNGGAGADVMRGGKGDDVYLIDSGDVVSELVNEGTDTISTADSFSLDSVANVENLVGAGTGNTILTGNGGSNDITGTAGNNTIDGGGGRDILRGGAGNDVYRASGDDILVELSGGGFDTVLVDGTFTLAAGVEIEAVRLADAGAKGAFTLAGNEFGNQLTGNAGNNTLRGFGGRDALTGGLGNDKLDGGIGSDALTGGKGKDAFLFTTTPNRSTNMDTIKDFNVKDDVIHLENKVFRGLKAGKLSKDAFALGTRAQESDDRVIYDKKSGSVFFDVDGAGGRAAVKFAQVKKGLSLTEADFFVI
ncbi:MAG TPA: NosD domain-containing protein [Microvirga sp.]